MSLMDHFEEPMDQAVLVFHQVILGCASLMMIALGASGSGNSLAIGAALLIVVASVQAGSPHVVEALRVLLWFNLWYQGVLILICTFGRGDPSESWPRVMVFVLTVLYRWAAGRIAERLRA